MQVILGVAPAVELVHIKPVLLRAPLGTVVRYFALVARHEGDLVVVKVEEVGVGAVIFHRTVLVLALH